MHFKDGTLTPGQNSIWVCVGNTSVTTPQWTTGAAWNSNYWGVWHLQGASVADSTSNANNGTNYSSTAAPGQISGGAATNGSSTYFTLPFPTLGSTANWTFSVWFYYTNSAAYLSLMETTNGLRGLGMFINTSVSNFGFIAGVIV